MKKDSEMVCQVRIEVWISWCLATAIYMRLAFVEMHCLENRIARDFYCAKFH